MTGELPGDFSSISHSDISTISCVSTTTTWLHQTQRNLTIGISTEKYYCSNATIKNWRGKWDCKNKRLWQKKRLQLQGCERSVSGQQHTTEFKNVTVCKEKSYFFPWVDYIIQLTGKITMQEFAAVKMTSYADTDICLQIYNNKAININSSWSRFTNSTEVTQTSWRSLEQRWRNYDLRFQRKTSSNI